MTEVSNLMPSYNMVDLTSLLTICRMYVGSFMVKNNGYYFYLCQYL